MHSALTGLGFGSDLANLVPDGTQPARVVRTDRGMVTALGEEGEVRLWLGQLRPLPVPPTTGDWVVYRAGDKDLYDVLPRRTALARASANDESTAQTLAANVDLVGVCIDVSIELATRRLERFVTMAWASGAVPLVLLTKADVEPARVDEARSHATTSAPNVKVIVVNGRSGEGIEELRAELAGHLTIVLVGPSGVGKSTITNALVGREAMATGDVREGDGKGRHTTTTRELIPIPGGGVVLDTPGLRSLVPWAAAAGLDRTFPEIASKADDCQFSDCGHTVEPGCTVLAAVHDGAIDQDRYDGWLRLRSDIDRVDAGAASRQQTG